MREAQGEAIGEIPEGLYPGDYLVPVGEKLAQDYADLANRSEVEQLAVAKSVALPMMMDMIRADLAALGVAHGFFLSEQSLHEDGSVDAALGLLDDKGLIYQGVLEPPKGKAPPPDWEPQPQTLFKSSDFGDDSDRALKKSDGSWTYFAPDIACHYNKVERGYSRMIDIWGADHIGYIKRMQSAVTAITDGNAALEVKICNLVKLMRGGEPVKMSKRAGSFITLREVVDEVGKDAVRFMMLTRKNDAPLDFDFDVVKDKSRDNPVFYVQYAHARICSVLRNAKEAGFAAETLADEALAEADLSALQDEAELSLIRNLANFPRMLASAAQAREPHRVAFYLMDLAAEFHALWNLGKERLDLRFIQEENRPASLARLALIRACANVIASGLDVIGVTPEEEMR
jgi:arginyl-tRNA synthetase